MWDSVQSTISNPVFGLVMGLVGFLIGNRLAIGRDKRIEFNKLIDPIRHDLFGMKNHPGYDFRGTWMITFTLIREKLPFWKRRSFDRAIENYRKSKADENRHRDGMGGFVYEDPAKIVRAVNDLLKYLRPR